MAPAIDTDHILDPINRTPLDLGFKEVISNSIDHIFSFFHPVSQNVLHFTEPKEQTISVQWKSYQTCCRLLDAHLGRNCDTVTVSK